MRDKLTTGLMLVLELSFSPKVPISRWRTTMAPRGERPRAAALGDGAPAASQLLSAAAVRQRVRRI